MNSLKLFSATAIVLVALTVLLLPLPQGAKITVFMVLAFVGVFTVIEGRGRGKLFAAIVIALLTLYLGVTVQRGILLMTSGEWVGVVLGMSLIVLPVIGAWAMIREIIFGSRIQTMAEEMAAQGLLPEDTIERHPSGRMVRQDADAQFEKYRRAAEENPEKWQNWFNLSLAYDASGDRKRARSAMREAIALRAGKLVAS
ncbi:hypothetical protein [Rothia sp. ZJ932]|uniref:hypothetical protein n=1 Tax=Rothia sp. ZJ932 TaxID=2810516 RepID=UPI0019672221|nr:hypothetical protein [Rothia sp. ZJ932]QRZ61088.1 hypothetical protein JR346_07460 [Rothia sp. ZJ932]